MKNIKFSIITVVYNGADCIRKTIESIINQTYENYEYIIIDGNSQDNTINIIEQYKHKITKVISEPDKGLYDAMNKGIKNANGDYIIFINCGDTLYNNNTFKILANEIKKHNYPDFIYGDAIEISKDGTKKFLKKARSHKFIWYGMFTHHQAMVYRTSIIKQNNLVYNIDYKIASDYAFTSTFLKYCKNIVYINQVICTFQQGGISMIKSNEAFRELYHIKRDILNLHPIQIFFILLVQKSLVFIRKNFENFYNFMRFKNVKET